MRSTLFVLFFISSLNMFAVDYYAEEKSYTIESGLFTGPLLEDGIGGTTRYGIAVVDLFEGIYTEGGLAYLYQENGSVDNYISCYLEGGTRYYASDLFSITPTLGLGGSYKVDDGFYLDLHLGVPVDFHIYNRNLLSIKPSVRYSENAFNFSLLFGIKKSISINQHIKPMNQMMNIFPKYFSPDGDGIDDNLYMELDVDQDDSLKNWSIEILTPQLEVVYRRRGGEVLPNKIMWDGETLSGDGVTSATEYLIRFTTTDYLKNTRVTEETIMSDILIVPVNGVKRVKVDSIKFPAGSFRFSALDDQLLSKNSEVLDLIASKLKLFPGYNIVIVGHGNILNWEDESYSRYENDHIVIPLTVKRAEAVMNELVARGLEASRLSARGEGGNYPVVSFGDVDKWKNRRVEFILEK